MEKSKLRNQLSLLFFPSIFISIFVVSFLCSVISAQASNKEAEAAAPVGVILDLTSEMGKGCKTSISLAYEDFYAAHPNYSTRVKFIFGDSMGDALKAANVATNLIKSRVQAIIGPLTSPETYNVALVCNRSQVPVISFSTTGSATSAANLPILIHATVDFSSEIRYIANFLRNYSWHSVIPVYEDSDNCASILPSLIHSLHLAGAEVHETIAIPSNAPDARIENELRIMTGLRSHVFIVHIMSPLAIRFFRLANKLGMVSKDYVWIVTSSIGGILNTLQPATLSSMNGVIGFRTHTQSDRITNFSTRYKARFQKDYNIKVENPSMYQLWAYDAVWVVGMAVEKAKLISSDARFVVSSQNDSVKSARMLRVSENEVNLISAIHSAKFEGLVGNFSLVDGQQQFTQYDILNVTDNQTSHIGIWTHTQKASASKPISYASLNPNAIGYLQPDYVKNHNKPFSACNATLKIGKLVREGFNKFVNATNDTQQEHGGLSMEVFEEAMKSLVFPPSITYVNVSADMAMDELINKALDGIVGDIIIDPDFEDKVYFTVPYLNGEIWVVVAKKSMYDRWIFLRPLSCRLWVVSIGFFFFIGIALWVIEHRANPAFRGPVLEQIGLTFYFAFSTLVYAHDRQLTSNFSRFLLIIWLFTVFVLSSSYTASLSSILTVQQLQKPIANSIDELRKTGEFVGYQTGSQFVKKLLTDQLDFKVSKLRNYSIDKYEEALNNGSANGGVGAIFDVQHYLHGFLATNCSEKYTKIDQTFSTRGIGFAFNRTHYCMKAAISEAIMNINDTSTTNLKNKYLNDSKNCNTESTDTGYEILSIGNFTGLFIITGVVSSLMVILFLIQYVCKNKNQLKTILRENNNIIDRFRALCKQFNKMDPNRSKTEVTTEMQEI